MLCENRHTGIRQLHHPQSSLLREKPFSFLFQDALLTQYCLVEILASTSDVEGTGLIGLEPRVSSSIYHTLDNDPSGDPPLNKIFKQDPSTPNYLTVLLRRSDDPDDQFPGDLT